METQWTRMTANEAAEIIQHNDMVAFSGFTPAGSPKAPGENDGEFAFAESLTDRDCPQS